MNEDNRKKVYDVLKSQTGYLDSYEDFNKAFDANEDNRKRVYDVLKSQTGYLDSYEDFSRGMGYPSSNQPGSVSQQVISEYDQAGNQSATNTGAVLNGDTAGSQRQPARPPFDAATRLMELMEENKPSLGEMVRKNGSEEETLAKKRDTFQVPLYGNARHMADRMRQDQAMRSETHDYRPALMAPVGKKKNTFEQEEERRIDEQYHPKEVENEADVLENYRNRFALSLRGGRLDSELAQKRGEVQEKHFQAFAQSPEYQDLLRRGASSEEISEKFYQQHGNAMNEEMRPYEDAFGKEMVDRYRGRIQEELAQLQKQRSTDQLETLAREVDELSQQTHNRLQRRAPSSGNAMNALMGSRNHVQSSEEERRQAGMLDAAQRLIEQSKEIVAEAGKRGNTNFVAGLGRGLRDNLDWENFTFGLADMADARYLHDALEKYERGETLSAAEQKLLEASAVNMAIQGFYSSDLGRGYNAGRVTAESIPFMLEFAINPISGSGNAIAKSLLKFGLRRFGRAGSFAARVGGATGAALGMTGTTGAPRVASNTMERLNQNYEYYLDEDDNLHVQKTGDVGTMEALGKSFASTALENQSEMILNAFSVFRPYLRQINDALPGGVNAFMQRIKNSRPGQLYREIKNNPTMREMMRRTQIQGFPQEYLEEVYNNFASIPLGDMTFEEAVDLDNNLDIIFGLTPTFLAFGMLGAGGMATERYQNRKRMERIFGKMTAEQRKKFEELQQMSKVNGNEEIKDFIKMTMADPGLTQEQKREAIEYVFALAKQNDMDEIQEAETQDKIDAETQDIVANSDQATNTYTECNRIVMNDVGEQVEVPGHIVGYMGGQPLWIPDGAEPDTEAIPLKEGEYNPESIRSMPVQEVIDETAQAIREDAAEQARRESTYSPDIVPYKQLFIGSHFQDKDGNQYEVAAIDIDSGGWIVEKWSPDGKPVSSNPMGEQEYLGLMQARIDAQEAASQPAPANPAQSDAQSGAEAVPSSLQGESNAQVQANPQPLTPQQQEVESLRQAGVDEEVIRNTIDDRVKKAKSALDKAERQAKAPIKDAQTVKEEMAARKKALDEARAVYEGWNALLNPEAARQTQQAQAGIKTGSISQGSSLTSEEVDALLADMEGRAEVAPELELTPENWTSEFGEDGLVQTPIGEVKMGENQLAKMFLKKRNTELGMIKPTLTDPDLIIEEASESKDGNTERGTSYLFVKSFLRGGKKIKYFTSVTVSRDGLEVVISNHISNKSSIVRKVQDGKLIYDKRLESTSGSDVHLAGNQNGQPDLLPSQVDSNLSEDKGTNHSAENQTPAVETIPTDEKGKPLYHRASVDATLSNINSKGLTPDEVDAFVQTNKDAAAKLLKKEEDKTPKMVTDLDKYVADKAAWQARVADAQAQVDYWNQVGDAIAVQRTQVGDTTAEDIRAMGEPMNGHELAAMMLATGRLPLLQSDFKRETGYKGDEARSLFGLFASEANGGMTIERAGEQLMLADLEGGTHFFDQDDPNAGRNAILDVLSEVRTRGDLTNYIRRNREALAERERQAEYDAYADWCDEVMHLTPEEYEAYQENIAENNPFAGVAVEELDRIFAEAEEEIQNNLINATRYGQEGTSENGSETDSGSSERDEPAGEAGGREASVPVLPEARPVLQGQEPGRVGGTETASGPADDGVRAAEGTVAEGASGGEEGVGVQAGTAKEVRAIVPERQESESLLDYAERVVKVKEIADARKEVSANPTDAQKEAGNYKKGHVKLDGYDITIENPKGSTRSGVDANGQPWSVTINNDYGYIRGTEGVDGDHIDVFLSDDPTTGKVYVIDQVKEDGSFDEHKVMYGFATAEEARDAYLANYSPGWKGLGTISEVSKEEFKKWVESSHRKTKPFAEYKKVKVEGAQNEPRPAISQEMDANGRPFVLASDGTSTFGNITEETGLTAAPIKLSEGFQSEDGKGYGLAHIEYRHGEQIRNAGFPSVEKFVEDVAKNFTVIKRGNARGESETYLLEVQDAHNNTLFVELSKDGSYWNVNSGSADFSGW